LFQASFPESLFGQVQRSDVNSVEGEWGAARARVYLACGWHACGRADHRVLSPSSFSAGVGRPAGSRYGLLGELP
jgi:hypothetical protein